MSYASGIRTPRAAASARYASTIRSGTNSPGIGGPVVDAPKRLGHPLQGRRLVDRLVADR